MLIAKESKPLFLEKDGTWVMNERYLGAREEPSSFASYGTWARTADKLVLTDSKGEKSYYRAKGDALEMLDREGNPIESLKRRTKTRKRFTINAKTRTYECVAEVKHPARHVFLYG